MTAGAARAAHRRVVPLVLLLGVVVAFAASGRPVCAQHPEPLESAAGLTGKVLGPDDAAFLAIALEPARTIAGLRPSLEAWIGGAVPAVLAIAYPLLSVDESAIGLHIGVVGLYATGGGVIAGPRFGLGLHFDPAIALRSELNILGDEGVTFLGLGLRLAL